MEVPPSRSPSDRAVASRIARDYLAPRWRALAVAVAAAVAFAALSGALVNVLQPTVNGIVRPSGAPWWRLPAIIIVLGVVRGLAQGLQGAMVNLTGAGVVGDIQTALFGKRIRADLAHLRAEHSGGFVSAVLYDSGLIREASTSGAVSLLQQSLTLAAAGVVMAMKDWRLTLVVLCAAPAVAFVLRRFLRQAGAAVGGAMRATSDLSTAIMEGLDGVRVVKMENREAFEEARVAAAVARRQRFIVAGDNARAFAAPVSETLMMIVVAAVLAYEGWRAGTGRADVGAFVAFFAALLMAAQSLRQVSNLMTLLSQGLVAARRLFGILDVEPHVRDVPDAPDLACPEGTVRLDDVRFSYGEAPILAGVSLEARRGEIVALVGPSGAGKSTILNLIPRFYDATGGALTIDGQDVRQVSLASLRRNLALVTQEPFLFDDSIGANIAYAKPGATPAEIAAAAAAAAAHDFIAALPKGYDTLVGEAGARLSGGQRQRIAIARAFLKDAPILLLDEATSALDTESEALVQAALMRLMAGRTTLLIAHRLSTVRYAQRIYVLDAGKVVETGTHDGLVAQGGLYARLAGSQDLAHLPEAAA